MARAVAMVMTPVTPMRAITIAVARLRRRTAAPAATVQLPALRAFAPLRA